MSDSLPPLLPCPFCGNDAAVIDDLITFHVECKLCGSTGAVSSYETGAIESWNRRVAIAKSGAPASSTGWVARKDWYSVPVLFDPYTGEPRDARDIHSDPQGILIAVPGAYMVPAHAHAHPQPVEQPSKAEQERDAIAELNHAQWLALENVRLLASRHRSEEWAQHMLRFVADAETNKAQIMRVQSAEQAQKEE